MTHFSELAVDRFLAGELADTDATALQHHAARCSICLGTLDEARATRDEFRFAAEPPLTPFVTIRRSAWSKRVLALAPLAAAAAVLITLAVRPRPEAVRTKGSAIVGSFVSHEGRIRRGGVHETVQKGDLIELVTSVTAPTWFAAVSESHGVRTVYTELTHLDAGREQQMPNAIELDGESEIVTGVFCTTRFDPASIDLASPPLGCTVDHFTLDKP